MTLCQADSSAAAEHGEPSRIWAGGPVPTQAEMATLQGVELYSIKPWDLKVDGYRFLHGVGLVWHEDKLFASFGHNRGGENTSSEEARGRISADGGRSWGPVFTIDPGAGELAVSHGVFLSHQGRLWAFHGAYEGTMRNVHARAYLLDAGADRWQSKGVIVRGGFWPCQQPLRMADGNWIMAGMSVGNGNPAAVAISSGDDLLSWELVLIPAADDVGDMWGESAVIVEAEQITSVARYGAEARPLIAVSRDFGRTWTTAAPGNMPMAGSKPYTGILSTGQRYLICTTAADTGHRRAPLTIAVSRPGEDWFSAVFKIRDAVCESSEVESHPGANLAYPYAVEHAGKLYVGYSNSGGRGGEERIHWNNNSGELAVVPVTALIVGRGQGNP